MSMTSQFTDNNILFRECTGEPGIFFDILPDGWKGSIVTIWPEFSRSSQIFVLELEGEVLGGGIVFSKVTPDTLAYKDEAQYWYDSGYLYLAYIWIAEKHRNKHLGSVWMQNIHSYFKDQKFWLAIEDYSLTRFYGQNGYRMVKQVQGESSPEWILIKD